MLMKKQTLRLIIGFIACFFSVSALAKEKIGPMTVSGNFVFGTDYVTRGMSRSHNKPTVQGQFDVLHESGFYFGIGGSNVRFPDIGVANDAHVEVDAWGGYRHAFQNGLNLDFGYNRYMYPGARESLHFDFSELYLTAAFKSFVFNYNFSPEYSGETGKFHYFNAAYGFSLPYELRLSAEVGYQKLMDFSSMNYTDWGLSLSKTMAGINWTLKYIGTDLESQYDPYELATDRVVLTAMKFF